MVGIGGACWVLVQVPPMYVTQEHPVPVAWLLESLETVRSSPSNRKRPSASQRPRHPEQQDQQRQQRILDLNAADSAALEAMPYIGPVLAARICRFRNALGGFHAVEQLREVWGLKPEAAERLMPMFHTGRGSTIRFVRIRPRGSS